MSPLEHGKSVLSLVIITLNLAFWVVLLVLLGLLKAVLPPARDWIDGVLEDCYRLAVAVDDAWLRGVVGARWRNPPLALPRDEVCLVLSNHASWADILMLQSAIARRGPVLKFLTKRELMWVPIFGVIFWAFDFPLLRRRTRPGQDETSRRAADAEALAAACDALRRRPAALANFAEGTRFTPEKRAAAGGPHRHVLSPRVGGVSALVDALGADLVSVVDVTIVSPAPLSFWEFLSGRLPEVEVEAERIPASTVPGTRAARAVWLEERWAEKDERIEQARRAYALPDR